MSNTENHMGISNMILLTYDSSITGGVLDPTVCSAKYIIIVVMVLLLYSLRSVKHSLYTKVSSVLQLKKKLMIKIYKEESKFFKKKV